MGAICAFLSLDDMVGLHEGGAALVCRLLGLPLTWDSVIWPVVYLPLMGTTGLVLLLIARSAEPVVARSLRVGLLALAIAVILEVVSAPWSTDGNWVHVVEGGLEQALELFGWILLAAGTLSAALWAYPDLKARQKSREEVSPVDAW